MSVSESTAGKGREEETLIEIPSAMSGKNLVSEWHTQTNTRPHIFTLALALIKVGFAIWRPCAKVASLRSAACMCVCVFPAGEAYSTKVPGSDAWRPMTCVWEIKTYSNACRDAQSNWLLDWAWWVTSCWWTPKKIFFQSGNRASTFSVEVLTAD